jgi:hypothetical protein
MTATTGIPAPVYDPRATLREGRGVYFERYGFGDGGYDAKWVELNTVAGIPVRFPNSPGRVRAVKLHDLHHVLTGYAADYTGEAEIGAWELAAGCGRHVAAWILNAGAFTYGAVIAPSKVLRAFSRGRRTHTLYSMRELDESILGRTIAEQRRLLGLDAPALEPTVLDRLVFAAAWLASVAFFFWPLALIVSLLAAWLS